MQAPDSHLTAWSGITLAQHDRAAEPLPDPHAGLGTDEIHSLAPQDLQPESHSAKRQPQTPTDAVGTAETLGFDQHERQEPREAYTAASKIRSLTPLGDPPIQRAALNLRHHARRLESLREDVLSLRTRAKVEWQVNTRNLDFVRESQSDFLKEAEALLSREAGSFSTKRLRQLYNRVVEDHDRQYSKIKTVQNVETQLLRTETKMQRLERKIEAHIRKFTDLPGQVARDQDSASIDASGDSDETASIASAHTRADLPGVVLHYLDKLGDMKIEQGKLYDLGEDYEVEKAQRQLLEEQEKAVDQTEEEFEKCWLQIFAEAELALMEASNRLALARKACELEDIDPEAYHAKLTTSTPAAKPAPQDMADLDTQSEQDYLIPVDRSDFIGTSAGGPFSNPSAMRQSAKVTALERVASWVDVTRQEHLQPQSSAEEASLPLLDDQSGRVNIFDVIALSGTGDSQSRVGSWQYLRHGTGRSRAVSDASPSSNGERLARLSDDRRTATFNELHPSTAQSTDRPEDHRNLRQRSSVSF